MRARLSGWSVCEDTCDTAALVISELVTNAIVHTASAVVVCELHDGDEQVRLSVRDEGCAPGETHPSPQRSEEEHGRGLLLVEALCHSWGAQEHGLGLLVWADLPRNAEAVGEPAEDVTDHAVDLVQPPATAAAPDHSEPRDDLGWGSRPEPDAPSDETGDEDEPAEQTCRIPRVEATASVLSGTSDTTARTDGTDRADGTARTDGTDRAIRTAPGHAGDVRDTDDGHDQAIRPTPRRAPEAEAHRPERSPLHAAPETDGLTPSPYVTPQRRHDVPEQKQQQRYATERPDSQARGTEPQGSAQQATGQGNTARQATAPDGAAQAPARGNTAQKTG
ncbi:ATP-binding protein, partial [Streptomyces sp. NPDC002920]